MKLAEVPEIEKILKKWENSIKNRKKSRSLWNAGCYFRDITCDENFVYISFQLTYNVLYALDKQNGRFIKKIRFENDFEGKQTFSGFEFKTKDYFYCITNMHVGKFEK